MVVISQLDLYWGYKYVLGYSVALKFYPGKNCATRFIHCELLFCFIFQHGKRQFRAQEVSRHLSQSVNQPNIFLLRKERNAVRTCHYSWTGKSEV